MMIGKLAKAANVNVETIRFYERRGLLHRPDPIKTTFREYPPEAVDRIRFIKRAKDLGFTLSEISDLLQLEQKTGASRREVKTLAESKLTIIRGKIADLQRIESTLSELVVQCSGRGSLSGCPIIQTMTHEPPTSTNEKQ
ncbi:MerR family transcriptional regulator [Rhodopirellula maiorica SM1]|uniref:Mercuric resistance operon regulatory protein n=1 Tax=Rhodopirellula maiorica SM1 TaxID=1265738 RepID=M5RM78_9BACT|nr:MerR family transcriptional regulator [Rhodopirellula maiorica]EMI20428.1 MerR family transcriptional regulator [Rhodopirellula maiorica SM1]